MKNFTLNIALIGVITLLSFNHAHAQHAIEHKKELTKNIVQQLNTPTKIWVNGHWDIQLDGSRVWKKGYWKFEEKSFQEKSKLLRKKSIQKRTT
ncbi:MAG: hypothetical protein CMP56_02145 [Flavobacteriales bacterium]|nr:hypothetical protein [Flavobacteriales bacterium]|tara:strand:+ start:241 stop:522 length:282 start_codon:yes stop_codon:yes gene_type:complete